jgi:hypothetical protein
MTRVLGIPQQRLDFSGRRLTDKRGDERLSIKDGQDPPLLGSFRSSAADSSSRNAARS